MTAAASPRVDITIPAARWREIDVRHLVTIVTAHDRQYLAAGGYVGYARERLDDDSIRFHGEGLDPWYVGMLTAIARGEVDRYLEMCPPPRD